MPRPPLWLILVGLFLADVLALIVVVLVWGTPQNTFQYELAKGLLQVGLVVVLGAALSLLLEENRSQRDTAEKLRDEDRELRQYREELIKTTLQRATIAYSSVKRARRLMRALAVRGDKGTEEVAAAEYDARMLELNDAQLEFESLERDVVTSGRVVFSDPEAVARPLKRLSKYLGHLVTEYEEQRPHFHGDASPRLELKRLPLLAAFLEPRSLDFFENVALDLHRFEALLRRDLVSLTGREPSDGGR